MKRLQLVRGEDGILLDNFSRDPVHSFAANMGRQNDINEEIFMREIMQEIDEDEFDDE